ncbi:MAG: hypothetical protein ACYCZL_04715 [Polaromonas sp.]
MIGQLDRPIDGSRPPAGQASEKQRHFMTKSGAHTEPPAALACAGACAPLALALGFSGEALLAGELPAIGL